MSGPGWRECALVPFGVEPTGMHPSRMQRVWGKGEVLVLDNSQGDA